MPFRSPMRAFAFVAGASLLLTAIGVGAPAFADAVPGSPPVGTAAPAEGGTLDYTGQITEIADQPNSSSTRLFHVLGSGYLTVDVSHVDLGATILSTVTLRLKLPRSLTLSDDDATRFQQLADYSSRVSPLTATESVPSTRSRTEALINQTPVSTAVHKIYAVLVTPSNYDDIGTAAANQTIAKVQTSVNHADGYWSNQSGGAIHFQLAATVPWYRSGLSCASGDQDGLWNEAAKKAAAYGYKDAWNTHLALFFPSDRRCGAIGLGTVGTSVNTGGMTWTVGTDAAVEQATLAHELGHNLSFGHAQWLDCETTDPHPGFFGADAASGCVMHEYGDVTDVMGFGIDGNSGGALSSPNAVRSGIWPSTDYAYAPPGTSTFTLHPVTDHTGLRSVILEDSNGVDYFVEFRNQAAEDSPVASWGCQSDSCAASTPGIRVMRADLSTTWTTLGEIYMKGGWGDDSYLFGHLVGGVEVPNYQAGEQFHSQSTGGVTIHVDSVTPTAATVTVSRTASPVLHGGKVAIVDTVGYDSNLRVGDRLTAMISAEWTAENYTFQWYRTTDEVWGPKVAISGATHQGYLLSDADQGEAMTVKVTGKTGSSTATAVDPDPSYSGIGPVYGAPPTPLTQGTVSIDASAPAFKAVPDGFGAGAAYHYTWRRDGSAISGATAAAYSPTTADRGHQLSVSVHATKSGSASYDATSPQKDYTLTGAGSFVITGSQTVGVQLAVTPLAYSTVDGAVSPTLTFQWSRNGSAISGATSAQYTVTASDLAKTISVRQTASKSGYIPQVDTATASSPVAAAPLAGTLAIPIVADPVSPHLLVSSLPAGGVTTDPVTKAYQWYRNDVAIAGATKVSYGLTSADVGKVVKVRYTITKAGYATYQKYSVGKNYSVSSTGTLAIGGTTKVGSSLTVNSLAYSTADGALASPTLSYQWYRSGKAVTGSAGTGSAYALTAADYAKTITVKVTGTRPFFLGTSSTSPATAKIGKGDLHGVFAPVVSTDSATATRFVLKAASGITEAGAKTTYQWMRNGAAISKATQQTYAPAASDYGKLISVKVTVTKLDYLTQVGTSVPTDYSLKADYTDPIADHFSYLTNVLLPRITGAVFDGQTLTAVAPKVTVGGAATPSAAVSYQWYRSGALISGATSSTYLLQPADRGKGVSVTVKVTKPGLLPVTASSVRTQAVGLTRIDDSDLQYHVAVQPNQVGLASVLGILDAPLGDGMAAGPPIKRTYQWYRGASPISGKTAGTYTLTSADYEKDVWLREVVSLSGATTVVKESIPVNYSIHATGTLAITGTARVGETLGVNALTYTTDDGAIPGGDIHRTYQWLRSGGAITGATASTYVLGAADYGKTITVRVSSGPYETYLPAVRTSAATVKVAKGVLGGADVPATVTKPDGSLVLTADSLISTSPATVTYQWYRGTAAISKATHQTYTVTSADAGKLISARLTVSKSGYATVVKKTAGVNYTVVAVGLPTLDDTTPSVDGSVTAILPAFTVLGSAYVPIGPDVTYQWYRNGAALPGQTNASYQVLPADAGKRLSVKVTARKAGFLPVSVTSALSSSVS